MKWRSGHKSVLRQGGRVRSLVFVLPLSLHSSVSSKGDQYAIIHPPVPRPRNLCVRFWLHDLS
jgi:hypothetical protein